MFAHTCQLINGHIEMEYSYLTHNKCSQLIGCHVWNLFNLRWKRIEQCNGNTDERILQPNRSGSNQIDMLAASVIHARPDACFLSRDSSWILDWTYNNCCFSPLRAPEIHQENFPSNNFYWFHHNSKWKRNTLGNTCNTTAFEK